MMCANNLQLAEDHRVDGAEDWDRCTNGRDRASLQQTVERLERCLSHLTLAVPSVRCNIPSSFR